MKVLTTAEQISTSDFFYDLFDGGYIDPDLLVDEESAKKVKDAVATLEEFKQLLLDNDLMEYL